MAKYFTVNHSPVKASLLLLLAATALLLPAGNLRSAQAKGLDHLRLFTGEPLKRSASYRWTVKRQEPAEPLEAVESSPAGAAESGAVSVEPFSGTGAGAAASQQQSEFSLEPPEAPNGQADASETRPGPVEAAPTTDEIASKAGEPTNTAQSLPPTEPETAATQRPETSQTSLEPPQLATGPIQMGDDRAPATSAPADQTVATPTEPQIPSSAPQPAPAAATPPPPSEPEGAALEAPATPPEAPPTSEASLQEAPPAQTLLPTSPSTGASPTPGPDTLPVETPAASRAAAATAAEAVSTTTTLIKEAPATETSSQPPPPVVEPTEEPKAPEESAEAREGPATAAPEAEAPPTEGAPQAATKAKEEAEAELPAQTVDGEPLRVPSSKDSTQVRENTIPNAAAAAGAAEVEKGWLYSLDPTSCGPMAGELPTLNATVERILRSLDHENCHAHLRLRAARNRMIRGHVMEINSMAVPVSALTRSAKPTLVTCSLGPATSGGGADDHRRLRLTLEQDMDDQRLVNQWRLYPQTQQNDIPLNIFGSKRGGPSSWLAGQCQRFRFESGECSLDLVSFRSRLVFEAADSSRTNETSQGERLRMTQFQVQRLLLGHSMQAYGPMVGAGRDRAQPGQFELARPPTVQILHDHNNHYRRNHWLLDMYGNWIRHEYRGQLRQLLADQSSLVVAKVNSCLM